MKSIQVLLLLTLTLLFNFSYGQITSVPQSAKDAFAKQYPTADDVEWKNEVINVNAHFILNGERMNAEYSNKGIWKNTYQQIVYENLPSAVQDGFTKSKYADREVTDVKKIYYPADVIQFRIKVEKNDLQKKYLYFDTSGKLLRDANTL